MTNSTDNETKPISRDDIAQSIREVRGDAEDQVRDNAPKLIPVAVGASLLLLIIAFLIGRRVGTTRSTVVEIRRV